MNNPPSPTAPSQDAPSGRMYDSPRRRLRTTGLVALVVVAIDIASKDLVLRSIGPTERIRLFGTFSLVRRFNTGAAFSVGNGSRLTAWLVTLVVGIVVVGVTRHLLNPPEHSPVPTDRRWLWVLGLIVGGALGNQLDRLFRGEGWNRGAVVDFIDPGFFPIFNVADSALTVGCIAAAALSLLVAPPESDSPESVRPESVRPESGVGSAPVEMTSSTQVPVASSVTQPEESTVD